MFEEFINLTGPQARNYMNGSEHQSVRGMIAYYVIKTGGSVLDVGCGRGIDAFRYNPKDYLGIDVSPILIKVARIMNPKHKFKVADAQKLNFKDKSFDNVICKSVLEHLPSEEIAKKVIKEMVRVCKKQLQIAWHTLPHNKETQIMRPIGHFGKVIYQNRYNISSILKCFPHEFEVMPAGNCVIWRLIL